MVFNSNDIKNIKGKELNRAILLYYQDYLFIPLEEYHLCSDAFNPEELLLKKRQFEILSKTAQHIVSMIIDMFNENKTKTRKEWKRFFIYDDLCFTIKETEKAFKEIKNFLRNQ